MIRIGIDAGHGGKDPGALGHNQQEKTITLDYALALGKEIEKRGYKAVQTRTYDSYISLGRRSTIFNNNNVDIAISLHLNAFDNPSANGIETFHHAKSKSGQRLASCVHSKIKGYWKSDRGLKTNNLHMTREPVAPAILIELGFITNFADLNSTLENKDKIVTSIADGIDEYFNKNTSNVDSNKNTANVLYRVRKVANDPLTQIGAYHELANAIELAKKFGYAVFDEKGTKVFPERNTTEHWAEKHFNSLNKKGIKVNEKRFEDNVKRGELFALVDRITDILLSEKPKNDKKIQEGKNGALTYVKIPLEKIERVETIVANTNTKRETLQSMSKRKNPNFLINGGFYWTDKNSISHSVNLLLENKNIIKGIDTDFSTFSLVVRENNLIKMEDFKPDSTITSALGGSPSLIKDGVITLDHTIGSDNGKHPRTAIGINDEYLILATIDGRQINKPGATIKELASNLKNIGATNAIALDGGGSTHLMKDGKTINSPSENRGVHNAIGVWVK